mmetsp:Transcript_15494/g.29234  ORF Transcript_15494/g.29234 Transcript_15494/m.29234 type:complete len:244 (-) Transcript_15494:2049-2780(-)
MTRFTAARTCFLSKSLLSSTVILRRFMRQSLAPKLFITSVTSLLLTTTDLISSSILCLLTRGEFSLAPVMTFLSAFTFEREILRDISSCLLRSFGLETRRSTKSSRGFTLDTRECLFIGGGDSHLPHLSLNLFSEFLRSRWAASLSCGVRIFLVEQFSTCISVFSIMLMRFNFSSKSLILAAWSFILDFALSIPSIENGMLSTDSFISHDDSTRSSKPDECCFVRRINSSEYKLPVKFAGPFL